MDNPDHYDAIVIGVGQGGDPLARAYAGAGKRVALIEREAVGGSCVNYGCTPTKRLVHIAKVADTVRRAADYGVTTGPSNVDMKKVRALKRAIVDEFRDGTEKHLKEIENVDLIFGEASFSGHKTVKIQLREGGTREITGEKIFLNTGTRAAIPPMDGLNDVPFLDNKSVMELDHLPARLFVLGGGYIGLEFAQMYSRFGSKVTVLEQSPQFLGREDRDVADEVLKILREDGIEVLVGAIVTRVSKSGPKIHLEIDGETKVCDALLVAVGRTPNTDVLNLKAAGVEIDEHGYIKADSKLRTTAESIYAIGDVKGGPAFTHISYDDFRVLKANLLDGEDRTIEDRFVPYVMFIDPQLGRIGLSEEGARKKGERFKVAKIPMTDVARAEEMLESRGFVKALISEETDLILGAAVLGIEGGEIMSMLQLAMMGRVTATALKNGIFAHPTLSELLNNLFG